jgi:hypothetical protein
MTQIDVVDVTFPSRDATTKWIAWIQAAFATERATYVSSLPGSPGTDLKIFERIFRSLLGMQDRSL